MVLSSSYVIPLANEMEFQKQIGTGVFSVDFGDVSKVRQIFANFVFCSNLLNQSIFLDVVARYFIKLDEATVLVNSMVSSTCRDTFVMKLTHQDKARL